MKEQNQAEVLTAIINQRKSIFPKDYSDVEVSDDFLEQLIDVGRKAPNHKRTRPWHYKIFKREEKIQLGLELQSIYKATTPEHLFLQKKYDDIAAKVNKAGALISIVCEMSPLVPEWEEVAAVAMGVQNMYLLCTAEGIGCYWSSPKIVNELKQSLKIEENQTCLGLLYVGHLV